MMSVAPVLAPAAKGSVRLLIVDDSVQDAVLMVAAMERDHYSILFDHVDSPESLRSRLAQGEYDAVLCDHNLRTWTAKDALQIIQSMCKDVPFIVVTGTLGDERAVQYLKDGASDYILKERLHRLPDVVDRALREKMQRNDNARLQRAIWTAKKDWERTFDAIPDSIMLLDPEYRITRANRATAELLGVPLSQIIGKTCFELVHCTSAPPVDCPFPQINSTKKRQEIEFVDPRLHRTLREITIPLRNDDGSCGAIHVMQDLTERKHLEEALMQAQKLEAVGRLAGGVAHDFNNILSVILGYSELLQAQLPKDETSSKRLDSIIEAVHQAAKVTSQLLAFSRKQVMQPTIFDVNNLVVTLSEMLHRLIGENIELAVTPAAQAGYVKADPIQFEQILMNLVVNARDAMPKGGRVAIATNQVHLDTGDELELREQVMPGEYVMVSVSDSGTGMTAETMKHVFEPFFTTKDKAKGTGLGLAIVYGIVKQSGGYIAVNSEPEQGSTFTIYLPAVVEQAETQPEPTISQATPGEPRTETILLVEDDERIASVVSTVLESDGYTVLRAAKARDALDLANAYGGQIDLMLTDVVLRGQMDGTELAQAINQARPSTKIVFMSGYSDSLVSQSRKYNSYPLLKKPFTIAELQSKISGLLTARGKPSAVRAVNSNLGFEPS